ncbi:hypothetical protein MTO96_038977 [Rhipicephalus appendiculatus]
MTKCPRCSACSGSRRTSVDDLVSCKVVRSSWEPYPVVVRARRYERSSRDTSSARLLCPIIILLMLLVMVLGTFDSLWRITSGTELQVVTPDGTAHRVQWSAACALLVVFAVFLSTLHRLVVACIQYSERHRDGSVFYI